MIISDEHRLAFIHVPKCAGVTISNQLSAIDSSDGFFWHIKPLPGTPLLADHAHLTMDQIERYYPDCFDKLRTYETYALVRDPVKRFWSAVHQRINARWGYQADISVHDVLKEGELALRHSNLWANDPAFVHFVAQSRFVFLGGTQIVKNLIALENIRSLGAALSARTGMNITVDRIENASSYYRFEFAKLEAVKRAANYRGQVPWKLAAAMVIRSAQFTDTVRASYKLTEKIRQYYAEDERLYRAALGA